MNWWRIFCSFICLVDQAVNFLESGTQLTVIASIRVVEFFDCGVVDLGFRWNSQWMVVWLQSSQVSRIGFLLDIWHWVGSEHRQWDWESLWKSWWRRFMIVNADIAWKVVHRWCKNVHASFAGGNSSWSYWEIISSAMMNERLWMFTAESWHMVPWEWRLQFGIPGETQPLQALQRFQYVFGTNETYFTAETSDWRFWRNDAFEIRTCDKS